MLGEIGQLTCSSLASPPSASPVPTALPANIFQSRRAMLSQNFHHDVLGPVRRLLLRVSENVCVQPKSNDVVVLAGEAAIAAHHFREVAFRSLNRKSVTPMANREAEDLRQRIADVADTRKHGMLRDRLRTVEFVAVHAFEFNNEGKFRFLRIEVEGVNKRWGNFDVVETVVKFAHEIQKEFSLNGDLEISVPKYQFIDRAEIFFTEKTHYVDGAQLKFYRRERDGNLFLADPGEVKFVLR
jgi:hypothetical protein